MIQIGDLCSCSSHQNPLNPTGLRLALAVSKTVQSSTESMYCEVKKVWVPIYLNSLLVANEHLGHLHHS